MDKVALDKATVDNILVPVDAAENRRREKKVRANFWTTMRRAAGKVPFMDEVAAAYFCAVDPRTPSRSKAIVLAALAYFVMPFDIVPDFLAIVGFTDDVAVLTAALAAIRPHIKERHRKAARDALSA